MSLAWRRGSVMGTGWIERQNGKPHVMIILGYKTTMILKMRQTTGDNISTGIITDLCYLLPSMA